MLPLVVAVLALANGAVPEQAETREIRELPVVEADLRFLDLDDLQPVDRRGVRRSEVVCLVDDDGTASVEPAPAPEPPATR